MLKLFEPKTKIQKNRELMRDTDFRLAKYGRRGLITNLFVFGLCIFTSNEFVNNRLHLTIVLSTGLLLITLVRGYYLFRIDAIYPRAPSKWRNKYFISTLIGASWWSVIMSSITLVLGMQGATPLMWLYTVVFFSTTAHAFSPFKRFLSIYQFIGIIPAALCTLATGELVGVLYAIILFMFYWILHHHSELMSESYWEHLEANYALVRKAESLEEEKRDTRASVVLSNEYISLLPQRLLELKSDEQVPQPILESLQDNLQNFYRLITKDIHDQPRIFNVRHLLQFLVNQHQEAAEKRGIELEAAIAPALPSRLVGDAEVLAKIIDNVIGQAIAQSQNQAIFVDMEFTREYENSGRLLITVSCQNTEAKRLFFNEATPEDIQPSLELTLAKGLAEVINGTIEVGDSISGSGKSISLRARMNVAELNPRLDYHRLEYKRRPLLLIHNNPRWIDHKRHELDTLGFEVATQSDYKKAVVQLQQAINQGAAFESVVYSTLVGDESAVDFANELLSHNELKYTQQFVICSRLGKKFFQDRLISASGLIHFVTKPSSLYAFELAFNPVFCESESSANKEVPPSEVLWVTMDKVSNKNTVSEWAHMHIHHVDDKKQALKILQEYPVELVIVEGSVEQVDEVLTALREFETKNRKPNLVPVVAVGDASLQRTLFEKGVDQFVTLDAIAMGETNQLSYWLSGRHI